MIDSSRQGQERNEGRLASGITSWMRGEDGPDAIAAGRIIAATIIKWDIILDSKLER